MVSSVAAVAQKQQVRVVAAPADAANDFVLVVAFIRHLFRLHGG